MKTANQNNVDEIISQSTEEIKVAPGSKAEIVFIDIGKLHPHDDNPRKDVGDVTELAESIKKNGILQNLTVVPCTGYWYGDYTVIIGHRRLAAAKMAGLKEVPCVIREMNQKEQIATMLLENMQRSDLTAYEQAQGMQMMLDLGETVESVAEKTGFSTSTVRRRVRLMELDPDKVKEAEGRQINITEYDKLFEIEDKDKRNAVLEKIGTPNFDWELKRAVKSEQDKKKKMEIIKNLRGRAEEISIITDGLKFEKSITSVSAIPEFISGVNYYYRLSDYSPCVFIYRDYTDEEKAENEESKQKAEADREEKAERERQLEELFKQAFDMRLEFVKNLNNFKGKEEVIYKMAGAAVSKLNTAWRALINESVFNAIMDTSIETPFSFNRISEATDWTMKTLFALVYSVFENEDYDYYDCDLEYLENSDLDTVYDYIVQLGYEMSEEEMALRDGTHELYTKSEEEHDEQDED